ncbi:unannotated protein [freshwater metagenome]|uniref:Unannotated protein n=1 Tax=freshwater metagenome TaxID=449393 RepID=A0A6J7GZB2_9ZZZZ|nr:hypothetical protein [Actinomycetota bacterium]
MIESVQSLAVDTELGHLYVTGTGTVGGISGKHISVIADLDGKNCTDISTVRDETAEAYGLAVDPDGQKLLGGFWLDPTPGNGIKAWNLQNIMAGFTPVNVGDAYSDYATFPVVVGAPRGKPTVTPAAAEPGATLTCNANWSLGVPSMQFYAAPRGAKTYVWKRDGAAVTGAVAKTLTAATAGAYSCAVTASNAAGTTTVASSAATVDAGFAALRLSATVRRVVARGARTTIEVRVRNTGPATARSVRTCVKLGKGFTVKRKTGVTVRRGVACWVVPRLENAGTSVMRLVVTAPQRVGTSTFAVTMSAQNGRRKSANRNVIVR